jgi:hypothetical protein
MSKIEMEWEDNDKPDPFLWFDLCRQIAEVYPDAVRVAIAVTFEDGARVTYEEDKKRQGRMEREDE